MSPTTKNFNSPMLSSFTLLMLLSIVSSCGDRIGLDIQDLTVNLNCADPLAINFDPTANFSGTSCDYTPVACSDCDYVLEADDAQLDNDALNLPPGSRIGIRAGSRTVIDIRNFNGTADRPYTFVNCDGKTILNQTNSQEAIRVRNSSFLRITGTGSSDKYGIEITTGADGVRAYEKADNIEIDHLNISGVGVGIWVVTRPTCDGSANKGNYTQSNTVVHHNYIHEAEGEGMYIGGSKWDSGFDNAECPGEKLPQADLVGVRIYNNVVEDIGWDGIQVGGAIEDCEIYNNVIRNYGLRETGPHQAGMMINPGTTGKIFSNLIEGGTGNALFLLGFDNLAYSNLIVNCKMNAIQVGDRSPLPNRSYRLINNTMVNIDGRALNLNSSESVNNVFSNNFMANIGDEKMIVTSADNTTMTNNIITSSVENFSFENIASWNLTPTVQSELLDSGAFYNRDQILVDFLMRKRLVGEGLDIGAFESQDN